MKKTNMRFARIVCFVLISACLTLLGYPASYAAGVRGQERPVMQLNPKLAQKVGRQVWLNETGGRRDAITSWNASENFASVGIGHFIWFPAGLKSPFQESFPELLVYLRDRGAELPTWLDQASIPSCPWRSRSEFRRDFNGRRLTELREFLLRTVGLQAEFLALRMQEALPKILAAVRSENERDYVAFQFNRVMRASPDLYPLIDYVNFKGEGINPKEAFPNRDTGEMQGWGLKDVLLAMRGTDDGTTSVLNGFADAAAATLLRRIGNRPRDKRWQRGWLKRVDTYRSPLR